MNLQTKRQQKHKKTYLFVFESTLSVGKLGNDPIEYRLSALSPRNLPIMSFTPGLGSCLDGESLFSGTGGAGVARDAGGTSFLIVFFLSTFDGTLGRAFFDGLRLNKLLGLKWDFLGVSCGAVR